MIGDTLGVSKNAMSRVVHRVSKAFCAMGSCIIPNVGCEGSLYNVASTYKIPNYPHALSLTVCGDHKLTEMLETLFCILKNAYRCLHVSGMIF